MKNLAYIGIIAMVLACACDSGTEPVNNTVCDLVDDTINVSSPDTTVILSEPQTHSEYIIFNTVEFYLNIKSNLVVYSKVKKRVVELLRAGLYDANDSMIVYSASEGVDVYTLKSSQRESIVRKYYWPTLCENSDHINVRDVLSTYQYDIRTDSVILIAPTSNAREYNDSMYVIYDNGFYLYNSRSAKKVLISSDFNGYAFAPRLTDWDLNRESGRIAVHFLGVELDAAHDGLFEINIATGAQRRLLGHTDGAYTPRYCSKNAILIIRTNSVAGESYIIKYDVLRDCEKIIFIGKMMKDGSASYSEP
jgi:hypothetical protein